MQVFKAIIKGSQVKKNRDGKNPVRILQCEITDPKDIQSVELMTPDGEDSNPEDNTSCIIIQMGDAYKMAISVDDGVASTVDKGEKKIYSYVAGIIKASLHLLRTGEIRLANDAGSIKIMPNGKIQLRGSGDFAVGFNQLQVLWAAMTTVFNTHTHGALDISGTPGPSAPMAVDISSAKKGNIELEV